MRRSLTLACCPHAHTGSCCAAAAALGAESELSAVQAATGVYGMSGRLRSASDNRRAWRTGAVIGGLEAEFAAFESRLEHVSDAAASQQPSRPSIPEPDTAVVAEKHTEEGKGQGGETRLAAMAATRLINLTNSLAPTFHRVGTDGNGSCSRAEWMAAVTGDTKLQELLGLSPPPSLSSPEPVEAAAAAELFHAMFAEMDATEDEQISLPEFRNFVAIRFGIVVLQRRMKALALERKFADANVVKQEVEALLQAQSKTRLAARQKTVDQTADRVATVMEPHETRAVQQVHVQAQGQQQEEVAAAAAEEEEQEEEEE